MVADSNIFMDRVEGGPAQRARIDEDFLNDPTFEFLVPYSAVYEVLAFDPAGSQARRLRGQPGGARILQVLDPLMDPADVSQLTTANFNYTDLMVVETARIQATPVLTAQARFVTQVRSYPPRAVRYAGVPIRYAA
jgi:hypothetical protein